MSKKRERGEDVPGDAMSSQALFDRQMIRAASSMVHVDGAFERLDEDDIIVSRVVIRLPVGDGSEYLVVANATQGEHKLVAFHRAVSFMEAVTGFCERIVNGSMKWQADRYE